VARLLLALAVATASVGGPPAREAGPSPDVATNSVGMRMVRIAPGTFLMGSPPGEPLRQEEETPHRVTLTQAFRIAATEVTLRQWLAVMPRGGGPPPGDDRPVTSVSWSETQEFCAELSRREGKRYRLPTEAEWEYACRAGAASVATAETDLAAAAWHSGNSEGATHPVGLKAPNAWGLHDMLGNAAEWTTDGYAPYPREEVKDPTGAAAGATKVVRGGSWRSFPPALRCAARVGTPESYQLPHVGLRVVREVE
jgi:formylglycine-generating enzyme required for sulfatase activity